MLYLNISKMKFCPKSKLQDDKKRTTEGRERYLWKIHCFTSGGEVGQLSA